MCKHAHVYALHAYERAHINAIVGGDVFDAEVRLSSVLVPYGS